MNPGGALKRIGVMGGSFDPIHMGHLIVAQDAIERLELSELVLMPAAIPPHKRHIQQVDAEHRLNMAHIAIETDMRMSVSNLELQRGGISYTLDTVKMLVKEYPEHKLYLIIGSDSLVEFHSWYGANEILELCTVATIIRPGDDRLDELRKKIKLPGEAVEHLMNNVIEAHPVDISSTEIRMRVAEGLSIRYLVPPEVEMYMFEHGLYQG